MHNLTVSFYKYVALLIFVTFLSCNGQSQISLVLSESAKTAIQVLSDNNHLPIQDWINLYSSLKSESKPPENFVVEDELTMYGYSFLWNNELEQALEIFKLIVAEFSKSRTCYLFIFDSLL